MSHFVRNDVLITTSDGGKRKVKYAENRKGIIDMLQLKQAFYANPLKIPLVNANFTKQKNDNYYD